MNGSILKENGLESILSEKERIWFIVLNRIEIKWKFIQRNDTSESHSFLSNLLIFIYNMCIASSIVENYE